MTPKKSDEPPDAVFLQIAVLAGIPSAVQIEQFVRSLKSAVATISGHAGGLRQGAKAADRKIARDIFKFSGELDKRLAPLDTAPEGKLKAVGGAVRDEWNARLLTLAASALPVNQAAGNTEADEAATAALSGMVDMKPADPVEGVLIGQLIVASEAALSMYRRAWEQPPEYFEARMKYLAHADRATRTVALLTERLDHASGPRSAADHGEACHRQRRPGDGRRSDSGRQA